MKDPLKAHTIAQSARIILIKKELLTSPVGCPSGRAQAFEEEGHCKRVSNWFEWDAPKLYLAGEPRREIPPICMRARLVTKCAIALAYPGGDRLYQGLKHNIIGPTCIVIVPVFAQPLHPNSWRKPDSGSLLASMPHGKADDHLLSGVWIL